jgi:hypothetical protein
MTKDNFYDRYRKVLSGNFGLLEFLTGVMDFARTNQAYINSLMNQELENKNFDGMQVLVLAALKSPSKVYTHVLCKVLDLASSKINNDDVVDLLDDIGDPESVQSLMAAAKRDWELDEFKHINKKCVWALKKIGTVNARAALNELALNSPKEVRAWAIEELNR